MPSKNPILRLEDILENIDLIEEYTRRLFIRSDSFEIEKVRMRSNGVCCEYQKPRESSKASLETMIPSQPWSAIRAVGNILRHEYDRIDPDVIWRIVSEDLNSLKKAVESSLNKLRRQFPTNLN